MYAFGQCAPQVSGEIPGSTSRAWVERLAGVESPAFTMRRARRQELSGASQDPIVWNRALGWNVGDADGQVFVDLTAGFGVALLGHNPPFVQQAMGAQSHQLVHGMGDFQPSTVKIELLERLQDLAPWPDGRVALGLTGNDAVTMALKTAVLATGRPTVLAFEGSYHGLGYGPLGVSGFSNAFREPFLEQLNPYVIFAPYPRDGISVDVWRAQVDNALGATPLGAVILEPMQGRGGVVGMGDEAPAALRGLLREQGAVLIADEVLTGLGRCGNTWLSTTLGLEPDLLCVGKALGGGLPVSACLGRTEIMEAWGTPDQVPIHTGTFFGHPLGCATALATLNALNTEKVCERAQATGAWLLHKLQNTVGSHVHVKEVRGRGLLLGVEMDSGPLGLATVRGLLERGYITLPAGKYGEVVQLCPPVTVHRDILDRFVHTLTETLESTP